MNDQFSPEEVAKIVGPLYPLKKTKAPDKYKLAMVSITYRGHRMTIFAHLPVEKDGSVRFDYNSLANKMLIPNGCTYTLA